VGVWSGITVILSLLLVLATLLGTVAADWEKEVAVSHAPPTWALGDNQSARDTKALPEVVLYEPTPTDILDPIAAQWEAAQKAVKPSGDKVNALATSLPMGSDKWGRDVLSKTIKGAETSILVGLTAALMATLLGSALGAVSGWYGGIVDDLSNWLYNVFHSIPGILLILAIAAVLNTKGTMAVVIILGTTGWTGTYRLMRGEYLKHRNREFVRAADAIGASNNRRMFVHILPNVSHVILVQFSLLTVYCIKAEVILSFLGFGVPVDGVSWGTMLTEAQNDLLVGIWWQLLSATLAMSIFVTALSLLTDSLRDALDPKVIH
jgi:peptide/nickel transport system permease protein